MARRPGRPRASGGTATGRGTAQDVLAAAAHLFCSVGYSATSTYAVAERAGVRQASIYHHFPNKAAILHELLLGTVRPSLANAEALAQADAPAAARLWALCHADVGLLCGGQDNLGALYLLPEVADERFGEFHAQRTELRRRYADLVASVVAEGGPAGDADPAALGALVMGLVESVILRRRDEPGLSPDVAPMVADAALRLVGVMGEAARTARDAGARLRAALVAEG